MKNIRRFILLLLCTIVWKFEASAQQAGKDLLQIMQIEMNHELNTLKQQEFPAYFIEYKTIDVVNIGIQTSFGSIIMSNIDSVRNFTAAVRVGSYELDNTHPLPMNPAQMVEPAQTTLPWCNDEQLLRLEMWNATALAYERSKDQYREVLNAKDDEGFKSDVPDFIAGTAVEYHEPGTPRLINNELKSTWDKHCKDITALFLNDTSFVAGNAFFSFGQGQQYSVSSENQLITQNKQLCSLMIMGILRTSDNQLVVDMLTYSANEPAELPSLATIMEETEAMIQNLRKMKEAPIAEPYSGPALLSPQAAGVFFHEIFGHRVEGHRLADESDSHTFADKLGKQVLPKYINIYFDPVRTEFNGQHLTGSYIYDDEGTKSMKVQVVEKGILKGFLMSRKPVKGFTASNGHGRSMFGSGAVSRQSNMIVESEKTFTQEELRKKLIAECKRQKKEYGYYFKKVSGGLTLNSVYMANVFTVFPTEIYRIYADGRPDELVRQVSLIGTPLTMFSEIEAAGNDPELFPGYCGAESGSIPVTIVCPSFFVRKIETQKSPEYHVEKPLLVQPSAVTLQSK